MFDVQEAGASTLNSRRGPGGGKRERRGVRLIDTTMSINVARMKLPHHPKGHVCFQAAIESQQSRNDATRHDTNGAWAAFSTFELLGAPGHEGDRTSRSAGNGLPPTRLRGRFDRKGLVLSM
jgi:hypothetical protein